MALTIEISRIFPTHQDIDLIRLMIVDGGKKISRRTDYMFRGVMEISQVHRENIL